jgi:1,4-dihydroxy-2-naphthoate polyprenyltransferase
MRDEELSSMPTFAKLRAFVRLSRAKFLVAGILGFALGAAIARFEGAPLGWKPYLQGQLMVLAFHAMVHFSNDYYDREADALSHRTPWSGGSGVLVDGSLSPRSALLAALCCALIGAATVLSFAAAGKYVVATLGVAIGLLAWSYSAPPLRLLARGWGEIDTALIVAILFPLAGYATFAGTIATRAIVSTLPSAAAMLVLMFCVEYPDLEADARSGKRNLVVRAGARRARLFVYGAIVAAYAASALAVLLGAPGTVGVFSLLTIPLGWGLVRQLARGEYTGEPFAGNLAAQGVAFFLVMLVGSTLAYLAVL